MAAAAAAPPGRPSEPPSQKSFCTSTTISAVPMVGSLQKSRRYRGLAVRELEALPRQAHLRTPQPGARVIQCGQILHRRAISHQGDLQVKVVLPGLRAAAGRGPNNFL